jgi:dolichol-phosphate mannosyltransferase
VVNSISIFIPAYNEESTLYDVVIGLSHYLNHSGIDYEIILLDDASDDNTLNVMQELAHQNSRIRVIHFSNRQGLGRLMRKGYQIADKEWVMMISADGQFKASHLDYYLSNSDKGDIIAGNRVERYRLYPFLRKVVSRGFNLLSRLFFRVPIGDVAWSKLVRKDVFEKVRLRKTAAIVELELVVKAMFYGYKISEVKVPYIPRASGKSKAFKVPLLISSFCSFLMLWVEMNMLKLETKLIKSD